MWWWRIFGSKRYKWLENTIKTNHRELRNPEDTDDAIRNVVASWNVQDVNLVHLYYAIEMRNKNCNIFSIESICNGILDILHSKNANIYSWKIIEEMIQRKSEPVLSTNDKRLRRMVMRECHDAIISTAEISIQQSFQPSSSMELDKCVAYEMKDKLDKLHSLCISKRSGVMIGEDGTECNTFEVLLKTLSMLFKSNSFEENNELIKFPAKTQLRIALHNKNVLNEFSIFIDQLEIEKLFYRPQFSDVLNISQTITWECNFSIP